MPVSLILSSVAYYPVVWFFGHLCQSKRWKILLLFFILLLEEMSIFSYVCWLLFSRNWPLWSSVFLFAYLFLLVGKSSFYIKEDSPLLFYVCIISKGFFWLFVFIFLVEKLFSFIVVMFISISFLTLDLCHAKKDFLHFKIINNIH